MTPKGTLFFDEWQACLRAHYIHVIRTHDAVTEPTLRYVLLTTGLTEADLAALRAAALDAPDEQPGALDPRPAPAVTPPLDEIELPDADPLDDLPAPVAEAYSDRPPDEPAPDEDDAPEDAPAGAPAPDEAAAAPAPPEPHAPSPNQLPLF